MTKSTVGYILKNKGQSKNSSVKKPFYINKSQEYSGENMCTIVKTHSEKKVQTTGNIEEREDSLDWKKDED